MTRAVLTLGILLMLAGCSAGNPAPEAAEQTVSVNAEPGTEDAVRAEGSEAAGEERAVHTDGAEESGTENASRAEEQERSGTENWEETAGTEQYRNFTVDNVLHVPDLGEIHYCAYIPDSYDGSRPYSLYLTLPGYQGLYFQGAGENIRTEDFAFAAMDYNDEMIILAPQLEDWGETSADKTIALTEYYLNQYNIDPNRVYINGYSGGGETLSLVLDKRPKLYTAALMCSSRWDGGYQAVTDARTPVYFVIGESDEYYGSEPFIQAYEEIRNRYEEKGLSEEEIDQLAVLDVKPASYFAEGGVSNQHGGGARLFSRDDSVMGWLFGE